MEIRISIYRYISDCNYQSYMQDYLVKLQDCKDIMLLDILIKLKEEQDSTLSFRRSCREGVCGSDGMNINGKNGLACITPVSKIINSNNNCIILRPLPGLPVIRDLIVDMSKFYAQYKRIKPFLITNHDNKLYGNREYIQYPKDRKRLDGSYECILCACCSTFCPSFWWNPDKFLGPSALLLLYRFLQDNRDDAKFIRLNSVSDNFSVFRCHGIMNCVSVCPKGLNPTEAISKIKRMLVGNLFRSLFKK